MKVRQQVVDHARRDGPARINEDRRDAEAGAHAAAFVVERRRLERANHRGADGDHRPAAGDERRGGGRDLEPLGVHRVLAHVVDPHGHERTEPDVQGHRRHDVAASGERVDQRGGQVQAGGRRRDRAGLRREDRLVALGVVGRGVAFDVRRQRHGAVGRHQRQRVAVDDHRDRRVAAGRPRTGDPDHRVADVQRIPDLELLLGTPQAAPGVADDAGHGLGLDEQQLDGAAGGTFRHDPRRDHPRVIDDDHRAGRGGGDDVGQLGDVAVAQVGCAAAHGEQPGPVARGVRRLRDLRRRQVEGVGAALVHGG